LPDHSQATKAQLHFSRAVIKVKISYRPQELSFSETAGDEERSFYLGPSRLGERSERGAETLTSSKRNVIEIQGARGGHAVFGREKDFSGDAADGACRWHHDQSVQSLGNNVSREEKDGAPLVGNRKRVPADLTPSH
jgi:hypothetical protein